jgi:release factor glutamine methyltransferase
MRLVTLPGVFSPISDTWLLADVLAKEIGATHGAVLDVGTGSGALALTAARHGARAVVAVDVSRRALVTTRLNARLNGVRVRTLRSALLEAVGDARFDVIVSNPPYVPAPSDALPTRGRARAWDAGRDGRAFIDRLIREAPSHLRPGGVMLMVHSEICGVDATLARMRQAGLEPSVAARHRGPLGPLMRSRLAHLEAHALLRAGARDEDVTVLRGRAIGA